ncbi:MAG: 16S rRNA (guanine(966)-N(2))-methyltransferase RsmD [Pseudomonadota bacterium]
MARRAGNRGAARGGGVRIIAGRWRRRMLPVADLKGLRPTSDRARETLFSWLEPSLSGARCADLYAGTGALGLEALSRGAGSCVFVESQAAAVQALSRSIEQLDCADQAEVVAARVDSWRSGDPGPFDLIFADPPYQQAKWPELCESLRGLLRDGALLYVESPDQQQWGWPPGFELWREKAVGEARLRVLRRVASTMEETVN